MPLTLQRITPPTVEPVTLEAVKSYLRIDTTDEDVLVTGLITAAREDVEAYLRRQLLPATYNYYLDDWPTDGCPIRLPRPPTSAVTSITYFQPGDVSQILDPSTYQVDIVSEPARVMLRTGQTWPSVGTETMNAIAITYVAGWPTPLSVPAVIRQAILLYIGDLFEHREARLDIPTGLSAIEDNPTVLRLLWKHRLLDIV